MFLCQWSLDIVFGKQKQALKIIKKWSAEKMRSSNFRKSTGNRVFSGYVVDSAAHIVDEYVFESLEDFQIALADVGKQEFKKFTESIAPYIVSGSQKWMVHKMIF